MGMVYSELTRAANVLLPKAIPRSKQPYDGDTIPDEGNK